MKPLAGLNCSPAPGVFLSSGIAMAPNSHMMSYPPDNAHRTGHTGEQPGRKAAKAPFRAARRSIAVALVVGVAVVSSACSSSTGASTKSASSSTKSTITIHNFAYSPDRVTVAPGATVTVANHDQSIHTVTSTTGKFNTNYIPAGHTVTFTAPKAPGSYPFFCMIHQYMTGTLVVS